LSEGLLATSHPSAPPSSSSSNPSSSTAAPAPPPPPLLAYPLHVACQHLDPLLDLDPDPRGAGVGKEAQAVRHGGELALRLPTRTTTTTTTTANSTGSSSDVSSSSSSGGGGLTTLSLDCGAPGAAAGVGGIDSWGARPLPQHMPDLEEPRRWAFRLRPFAFLGAAGKTEKEGATACLSPRHQSTVLTLPSLPPAPSPAKMARTPPQEFMNKL